MKKERILLFVYASCERVRITFLEVSETKKKKIISSALLSPNPPPFFVTACISLSYNTSRPTYYPVRVDACHCHEKLYVQSILFMQ